MTSEELATAVRNFCTHFVMPEGLLQLCEERVLGPGDEQYSLGDQQVFELLPITKLADMFEEEIADVFVYIVMLRIRFTELGYYSTVQHLETFAEALMTAYCDLEMSLDDELFAEKVSEDDAKVC